MAQDVLVSGGHLVTMNPRLGDLPGADILIRDGIVARIGTIPQQEAAGARVVRADGHLVLPGLVDTHRHVWQGALGGAAPLSSLTGYVGAVLGSIAPGYEADDVYAGTLWGALQALNAGITTVADWSHNLRGPEHADAAIRALHHSGIRAIFLHGGPGSAAADAHGRRHDEDAARVFKEHFPTGAERRVRMGLALRGPAFSTTAATEQDFAFARDLGLPLSVHVGMAGFPGNVEALARLGLLGPDVNHAHANELTDREFGLIAETGGSISITPTTELTMALGTHPATGAALARGIRAGLGVDTVVGSGTDLFSEMRLVLAAERSRANADAVARGEAVAEVVFGPRDALELATVGGARVWGLERETGTLEVGKQADLITIDLARPHLDGFADPVTSAVFGAGPGDVATVLVGGEIVKADGRLVGPYADVAAELVERSRARLRSLVSRRR
jgi:cytosine/adenosine deaminase-related metal-dependent hydrolase